MGKIRALAAVVVLSATASGCWLQSGFDSAKSGFNPGESTITTANVADLEVAWTADVGTDAREALIRSGTAYVRSNGALTALDAATGVQKWTVTEVVAPDQSTMPLSGNAAPAFVDGTLQVPADGQDRLCSVMQLDPATGELIQLRTFGPPFHPPIWDGGCTTGDALEIDGAAMVPYNYAGTGPVPGPPCGGTPQQWGTVQGVGVVDVSGNTGYDGTQVSNGGCGPLPATPPPFGPQSVAGDEVLVEQGGILRAYPLTGCPAGTCPTWSLNVGSIVGPPVALANGDIAVTHPDGYSSVVDGTTHQVESRVEPPFPSTTSAPLAANATHFFVSIDGSIPSSAAIRIGCGDEFCAPEWAFPTEPPASARPSIGGDVLYVGQADGTITARPASCNTPPCDALFTHDVGARITGAPTIDDGLLLVGSEDGTVIAFRLPN